MDGGQGGSGARPGRRTDATRRALRPADLSGVIAWSEHEGDRYPAAVRAGRAVGAQFHPEKSSAAGVRWLHAFLDEARAGRRSR